MVSELITYPLRIGARTTRLWLRATEEAVSVAASVTDRLIDAVRPGGSAATPAVGLSGWEPPAPPQAAERMPALDDESPHISEEPQLVGEFAEPGAEEGAGAEVHVVEPWDGYEHMNAKQVIDRLAGASPAELAAVQLYESGRKDRQTVIAAVGRALRSANGSGTRS
jgi:hypothetical protein